MALPPIQNARRPERLRLREHTPAVIRLPDGVCTTGKLQVVSLSGGLLDLPAPLHPSVVTKLLFVTTAGPVLGMAEMLDPITHRQQPFRFVSMECDDVRRLQTAIKTTLYPTRDEDEWIQKYRSAVASVELTRKNLWPLKLTVIVLLTMTSEFVAYLHWLR